MRWHAERKKPDDGDDPKLRHVKDGSQWRALNNFYRYFECDARNIVLAACTDGMNLFGNQNTNHSTWPVFVWMGLLQEELDTLWKTPTKTWDASKGEYFNMRAALITTV